MSRTSYVHRWLLLSCSLVALTAALPAQQTELPDLFVPGELIVQFGAGVSEDQRRAVRQTHATSVLRRYEALRVERLRIPQNANPVALAQAFGNHPEVTAAQPNFIRRSTSVSSPNDPFFLNGSLWGLLRSGAALAWSSFGAGTDEVVVADIDSGVNYAHPDLAANMWRNPGEIAANGHDDDSNGYVDDVYGIDTANNDADPMDDEGHGTHTSGTLGAVSDNGQGITAVAPKVRILACKFIRSTGTGSDADAIECFNYIVALKQRGVNIRVTNNSWGALRGQFFPAALKNAVDAAGAAGIVNVFAAGNDGVNIDNTPFDPASFTSPSIVSVAASDSSDGRAGFSNYGALSVDLAAPGVDILSTYGSGYAWASGTSMAAPHVAGAAAMLLAHRSWLTVSEVKDALMNGVDARNEWTGLVATGGRLNVFHTLNSGSGGIPPSPVPSPDGATVPPASQIVDTAGHVWTIASDRRILRDGAWAAAGVGDLIVWSSGSIYVKNADANGSWWLFTGGGWQGAGDPRAQPPSGPSPDGATVPPASQIVDSAGQVWTIAGDRRILRDGAWAAGGVGDLIVWSSGSIYVKNATSPDANGSWWLFTGAGWQGAGDPRAQPQPGPSPDGAAVPPASQIVDAAGHVWTIAGDRRILRDGAWAAGGVGDLIVWSSGSIYVKNATFPDANGSWWLFAGAGWSPLTNDPRTAGTLTTHGR